MRVYGFYIEEMIFISRYINKHIQLCNRYYYLHNYIMLYFTINKITHNFLSSIIYRNNFININFLIVKTFTYIFVSFSHPFSQMNL